MLVLHVSLCFHFVVGYANGWELGLLIGLGGPLACTAVAFLFAYVVPKSTWFSVLMEQHLRQAPGDKILNV